MSNTIHDMGGMHGFGPVEPEPDEPVFHEPWEGRVMAMQRAMGYTQLWTIDGAAPPWKCCRPLPTSRVLLPALVSRLKNASPAHGLVGADEIKAGKSLRPGRRLNRKLTAADVPNTTRRGNSSARRRRRPNSKPVTRSKQKISIRQRIRGSVPSPLEKNAQLS